MRETIIFITNIVNYIHDSLIDIFQSLGFQLTDKQLHFWIIGAIGLATFFSVYILFKILSKWRFSITIISFVYTLTVMIVLVFAIEIQQGITNRGHMDFDDAVVGLWGFIAFFIVYSMFAGLFLFSKHLIRSFAKRKEAPSRNRRTRSKP